MALWLIPATLRGVNRAIIFAAGHGHLMEFETRCYDC
jgi:hypothetical protein